MTETPVALKQVEFFTTTIERLRSLCQLRAREWHADGEPWTLADWGNELAEEVGEVCAELKRLRRIQTNAKRRDSENDPYTLIEKARAEIADVIICAVLVDLALEAYMPDAIDMSLDEVVAKKFNATSAKMKLWTVFGELE